MSDLHDLLDGVEDRASFLEFVKALIKDRQEEVAIEKVRPSSPYASGANGWENGTIESFLEAAVACAEDNEPERVLSKSASWNSFATFLYVGKTYE